MTLMHDFLLVKEIEENGTIEGTNLKMKFDDSNTFMNVEIVGVSTELYAEYAKYYNLDMAKSRADIIRVVNKLYKKGNKAIIRRISKVPYQNGLYFCSFKDIIAILSDEDEFVEDDLKFKQLNLFESNS